jgi:hypothetical protein
MDPPLGKHYEGGRVVSQEEFKQDDEVECFTQLGKTRGMLKKKLISCIEVDG